MTKKINYMFNYLRAIILETRRAISLKIKLDQDIITTNTVDKFKDDWAKYFRVRVRARIFFYIFNYSRAVILEHWKDFAWKQTVDRDFMTSKIVNKFKDIWTKTVRDTKINSFFQHFKGHNPRTSVSNFAGNQTCPWCHDNELCHNV